MPYPPSKDNNSCYNLTMKQITFVTGNSRKVGEARRSCDLFDIEVVQKTAEIDEIQSSDPLKISEHKARVAYELLGEPVVVTDTFWSIPALNGFPGAYMKEVAQWFTEQDFLNLIKDKDDKSILFSENITYFDGKEIVRFSKEYPGKLVEPRGTGNALENVAEFDGSTLGEKRTIGGYSHSADEYVWYDFAKWYAAL